MPEITVTDGPRKVSSMLRRAVACLLLFSPVSSHAAPVLPRNELSLGAGYGTSNVGPGEGVPVVLRYGRAIASSALALVARGDVVLNAAAPDGTMLKGSSYGLAVGCEWRTAPPDRTGFALGGMVGGRAYTEPGAALELRLGARLDVPFAQARWAAFAEAGAAVGVARVGDESPRTMGSRSAEVVVGMRARF